MAREPYDVNFCVFTGCSQIEEGLCARDECWVNNVMVAWWQTHLFPNPLIVSHPPPGDHLIYNIYARKVGAKYRLITEVEAIPSD